MKIATANRLITLLKQGKKYKDGLSGVFVELYYEAPYFFRHEYNGEEIDSEASSQTFQLTEQEMLRFILSNN